MQIFLSILLFIVSLGLLVAIHELGHFWAAKAFNVYVEEYAIGFGPKLFSYKAKNGETRYSIRAIPLGGFCSMAGEGMEEEATVAIPKERTLDGISKPKKALIMAAGVILNWVLAFVLFFCANLFPQLSFTSSATQMYLSVDEGSAYSEVIKADDRIFIEDYTTNGKYGVISTNAVVNGTSYSLVTTIPSDTALSLSSSLRLYTEISVTDRGIEVKEENYIAPAGDIEVSLPILRKDSSVDLGCSEYKINYIDVTFKYDGTNGYSNNGINLISSLYSNSLPLGIVSGSFAEENGLTDADYLEMKGSGIASGTTYFILDDSVKVNELQQNFILTIANAFEPVDNPHYNANFVLFAQDVSFTEEGYYSLDSANIRAKSEGDVFYADLPFQTLQTDGSYKTRILSLAVETVTKSSSDNTLIYEDLGFTFPTLRYNYNFGELFAETGKDWANGNIVIFKALGSLFTPDGIKNVGGPVAVFTQTSTVLSNYSFNYYIYYWGLISVNLAIFNLLPFPGLDGWHLLVTAIEGITRKKVPDKVKGIVSFVGMVILFGLMILITIRDIFNLF